MTIRTILTAADSRLRRKAKKVKKFDRGMQVLFDDMLETMHHGAGVGLAAPQIGISQRIIVVELPPDEEDPMAGRPIVLVNPEIVWASDEREEGVEGCLSVPGWVGDVERAVEVKVRGLNRRGKKTRLNAHGYLARVLQHEIDHLDGVLFIDRVTDPHKLRRAVPEEEPAETVTEERMPAMV